MDYEVMNLDGTPTGQIIVNTEGVEDAHSVWDHHNENKKVYMRQIHVGAPTMFTACIFSKKDWIKEA